MRELTLIAAVSIFAVTTPAAQPMPINAQYQLGLLACDLSTLNDHGYFNGTKFLTMLHGLQRVLDGRRVSSDEGREAARALGYVQGVTDAFLNGAFAELTRNAHAREAAVPTQPLLCLKMDIKTQEIVDAVVRKMASLPKATLDASQAHSLLEGALLEDGFYVACH